MSASAVHPRQPGRRPASPAAVVAVAAPSSATDGPIVVSTVRAAGLPADLIATVPASTGVLSFLSEGEGLVGWGEFARFTTSGPDAAARIEQWWTGLVGRCVTDDAAAVRGSGPVVFVSLGFADTDESVAIVPTTVLGHRDGRSFVTTIGPPVPPADRTPITTPGQISYADGDVSLEKYTSAVAEAVQRINEGRADKVVLARDLLAISAHDVDHRHLLRRLSASYPTCWTFAVDGLVGATPEMLLRRSGADISSRVLAGTAWPERAGQHTTGTVATGLLASTKDLAEHAYAVDSVTAALSGLTTDLHAPRHPHVLPLANLTHLATDVTGTLTPSADGSLPGALAVAAALHPTAAVGGSPAAAARELIAELEPMARGRYAAPVGWMDAVGDGEFGIALRCALVQGRTVRMFAGCGVMGNSDPEVEAREAQIKMIPVRDALES